TLSLHDALPISHTDSTLGQNATSVNFGMCPYQEYLSGLTGTCQCFCAGRCLDRDRGHVLVNRQIALPGFRMLSGSNTALMPCCTSRATGPVSSSSQRCLSTPTPCSPVSVPPSSSARVNTSSAAAHTSGGGSLVPCSKMNVGCRLPSPACATVQMRTPCRAAAASIAPIMSGGTERGTHTSSTRHAPSRSLAS